MVLRFCYAVTPLRRYTVTIVTLLRFEEDSLSRSGHQITLIAPAQPFFI